MTISGARFRRWGAGALAALLVAALTAPSARAAELMLSEQSEPPYALYGWTFLGLSLVSLGVGIQSYGESQDALDKAKKNYKLYKAASTATDAIRYRDRTEKFHNRAKSAETRANLGLGLAVLLGLTALYSFSPEGGPEAPTLISLDGVTWQWRF